MKLLSILAILILTLSVSANTNDAPAVISAVAPLYPQISRAAHIDGEVSVAVETDSSGQVISTKATGHPLLVEAAKGAAKQWRFAPVLTGSIKRSATLIFVFKIMPRCSPAIDLATIFYPPYKIEVRGENPPITCSDCSPEEQEKLRCQNP